MAIGKLKTLGNGFTAIPVGKRFLIQSVPGELTMDHTSVLQQAEVKLVYYCFSINRYCVARLVKCISMVLTRFKCIRDTVKIFLLGVY
jgi:hypothetical protein